MSIHSSADEQQKLLDEALNVVKVQAYQMKRCLEANKFMDGLKHCSTMLAELRTSALTPKNYYELYMSIFDSLRYLTTYLHDAHVSERQHLADMYELVQYAGNVIPRLYLMLTVGSVYMAMPDAPVKELMHDMLDMSRGVQHPTRGLFLRHYLSGMTRDHLPMGSPDPNMPEKGCMQDSIDFILTNFTEMNKLWVRLQHQGHSREREKREMERKELRILVGTNLVRLSQLEGVDLELYQNKILPAILEQVVTCKDVIAQEYLMEVIIQVFHDDFHLRTLAPFLEATAKLHPKVNIRQIVIAMVDRLAAYAAREAESETSGEGQLEANKVADGVQNMKVDEGTEKSSAKKRRGIPEDVKLFEIFRDQVVNLVKARPDIAIQDVTALLDSLVKLALSCYPENLDYVDRVLGFAKDRVLEAAECFSADLHTPATTNSLLSILLAPVNAYPSVLTLLSLHNYASLLEAQSFATRHTVALAIVTSCLRAATVIDNPDDVNGVLALCAPLICEQRESDAGPRVGGGGRVTTPKTFGYGSATEREMEEELAEEQGHLARMVHLFRNEDPDRQLMLLSAARKQFAEGGNRIKYTLPAIVFSSLQLARRYKNLGGKDESWEKKCTTLFRFIHQVISVLYSKAESRETSFRLFLAAGQSADECGFEEIAYEFFVQAFTVYEDSISESKSQFTAMTLLIGALQSTSVFSADNYDTLITKCALHASKLLKKPDQCRAVYLCSHLFWATPDVTAANALKKRSPVSDGSAAEARTVYRDGKRVLECLQKALKIADSCMDALANVELFVEILNRYIYYYEKRNEAVTVKYLNGLIDLINTNLGNVEATDAVSQPGMSSSSALVEHPPGASVTEYVHRHFRNTVAHLQARKEQRHSGSDRPSYDEVDTLSVLER